MTVLKQCIDIDKSGDPEFTTKIEDNKPFN